MALDDGHHFTSSSLPTPSDTSFPTLSKVDSRQSSRLAWYTPFPSTSSAPLHARTDSSNLGQDETGKVNDFEEHPMIDTKRFTPNLHASLVAEILSLRRDIEAKNASLSNLEENLHSCKADNGQLSATVASQEKEVRSAKKQMQLLENGTLTALDDMAKERDSAVDKLAETRKRLEMSKKTVRARDEEVKRNNILWAQDKQNWDNERCAMERRIHVTEGRLKTTIAEFAAMQSNCQTITSTGSDAEEGAGDTWFSNWSDIISTRSSSVRGRKNLSDLSHNTYDSSDLAALRASTALDLNRTEKMASNNLSLADELGSEKPDEDPLVETAEDICSPDALPEETSLYERRLSNQFQDKKARKVLGLLTMANERDLYEETISEQTTAAVNKNSDSDATKRDHVALSQDAATQFSPSSSPPPVIEMPENSEKFTEKPPNAEHAANQSRKRVSALPVVCEQTSSTKADAPLPLPMVSSACQTIGLPESPALIPIIALEPTKVEDMPISMLPETTSRATQTAPEEILIAQQADHRNQLSRVTVPVIAIHPPGSRPQSSHNNVKLPPRTKNVGCQVSMERCWSSSSVAVQTEEIRVDKRPLNILPRSTSATTTSKLQLQGGTRPRPGATGQSQLHLKDPPAIGISRPRKRSNETKVLEFDQEKFNDKGLIKNEGQSPGSIDKSDIASRLSDQNSLRKVVDLSDDNDFPDIAPIRKTLSKVQNSWKLVPATMNAALPYHEMGRPVSGIQELDDDALEAETSETRTIEAKETAVAPAPGPGMGTSAKILSARGPEIRKTVLRSNGALAQTRQRSPSAPGPSTASTTVPPPFPVPTRSSSRKLPISNSEGAESPTPFTTSFITGARPRPRIKPPTRNPLRKVRSAAAVPKFTQSQSGQSNAQSSAAPSPSHTPLASPRFLGMFRSESTPQHSSNASQQYSVISEAPEPSVEPPSHATSVVDAIAQTMVGEWMWKYTRRRKSFGITESSQAEFDEARLNGEGGSGGVRHKRWVWLAPYERAVMWSNRQPTTGPALLGKSGRKCR